MFKDNDLKVILGRKGYAVAGQKPQTRADAAVKAIERSEGKGVRKKKPCPTEHQEQCAVMIWAEAAKKQWPWLGYLFAIPNGGNRAMAEAKRFKAEGVKAGVPDLCLPVPMGKYHALFIEMKSKNGTTRENQLDWIANLIRAGNCAVICKGADEAIDVLYWYCENAIGEHQHVMASSDVLRKFTTTHHYLTPNPTNRGTTG